MAYCGDESPNDKSKAAVSGWFTAHANEICTQEIFILNEYRNDLKRCGPYSLRRLLTINNHSMLLMTDNLSRQFLPFLEIFRLVQLLIPLN